MKEIAIKALRDIEASAENGIWEAHNGCAMLAGIFLVEEDLIATAAKSMVIEWLEENAASTHSSEFSREIISYDEFNARLIETLNKRATDVHEIGHDVIYSAYVLKALEFFSITPWKSLLSQMLSLVTKIKKSTPGWITVNGNNEQREFKKEDSSLPEDYWAAFSELQRPKSMEVGDMQLGHILTHGHAICMIDVDDHLKCEFYRAFRKRFHGLVRANEEEKEREPLPVRSLDPRDAAYWNYMKDQGDMHGHVLKYAYSFLSLKGSNISKEDLLSFGRILWPNNTLQTTSVSARV